MGKSVEPAFREFWREMSGRLIRFWLGLLWRANLLVLIIGVVAQFLNCMEPSPTIVYHAFACKDLQNPLEVLKSFGHSKLPLAISAGVTIIFGYMLGVEWGEYSKDKPSNFTHGTWRCESPAWMLKWKQKLLQRNKRIGQVEVVARDAGTNRYYIQGEFTEDEIRVHAKRFVGWWHKPIRSDELGMHWHLFIRNGDEVQVNLKRNAQSGAWSMRVEFYEWAGRRNPAQLVQAHVTEFMPLSGRPGRV